MSNGTRHHTHRLATSRLAWAGAGLLLLLAGCEAPRQAGQAPAPTAVRAGPATAEALAAALPASADSFTRGATVPVRQPMEGLEVNYATSNRRGAAFVQVVRPAQGDAPAAAAGEYTRWLDEVSTGARPGRRLNVVQEFTEPAGPGLRCAALEGSYGRQPVQSTFCVGTAGGHVLRLRVTMMRDAAPVADARAFLLQVARSLPAR
ncbi:hypothetical protein [Roseococcus suduntuyensis]|uniref:Lipoprotein n=1 Tax=Roseococcus suduntuyensis TaxID=455361 RepID=A0A840ABH7_9PROT|nr:hypothetical protein [Roseococcus suduntuyensis]MBB3898437.1 hypothetical protein [Roseococcus suduntuyensis]